jgi:hypothetical protein
MDIKTAAQQLDELWFKMKAEGNSKEYTKELLVQLELLGTESNTLTRQSLHDSLAEVLNKIKATI